VVITLSTSGENESFVRDLHACGGRFIVVGGLAIQHYCPDREANDLDLLLEPLPSTAAAAHAALARAGETPHFEPEELTRPGKQVCAKHLLDVDLLTPHEGENFGAYWSRSVAACLGGVTVRVASRDDLVRMKRNALEARPDEKDRRDIVALEACAAKPALAVDERRE